MSANSARRRRVQAKRKASQQWQAGNVAELDLPCPLHDLTHPTRRGVVFVQGVNTVLGLERAMRENACYSVQRQSQLTLDEYRLAFNKAVECFDRRRKGKCALLNSVKLIPAQELRSN